MRVSCQSYLGFLAYSTPTYPHFSLPLPTSRLLTSSVSSLADSECTQYLCCSSLTLRSSRQTVPVPVFILVQFSFDPVNCDLGCDPIKWETCCVTSHYKSSKTCPRQKGTHLTSCQFCTHMRTHTQRCLQTHARQSAYFWRMFVYSSSTHLVFVMVPCLC